MSRPLRLLRLLDALEAWNSQFERPEDREPVPEGTKPITVDEEVVEELAERLAVPRELVRACLYGVPVKRARALRDWVLSHQGEKEYDPALLLFRYANARVGYVSGLLFERLTGRRVA